MYNFKKYIAAFTSAALMVTGVISVTGCAADTGDDEKIELLDPVSVSVSCAPVTRRNIYSSKILSAICTPDVTECAFDSDIVFSEYTAMPGDLVKAGDILISSNTSDLDDKIKAQREYIASMQEDHDDTMEQLKDAEAKDQLIPLAIKTVVDDARLKTLSDNVLKLALPDSAKIIAQEVLKLANAE